MAGENASQPVELSAQLITIMTTEHYNLQIGRSMTISEANGRSSLFVGAVSSGLVALAFVGQISRLSTAFFVFGLIVIPTLLFMGIITFERVLQAGSADIIYASGINRIRHLYAEYAPQMRPYFILSTHDDPGQIMSQEAMRGSWWQVFLSTAGMVAVINSVLAGGFVGLLFGAFALPLWLCAGAGALACVASAAIHQRYQWAQWGLVGRTIPALFPSEART